MRSLILVCAALVVVLGVVCGSSLAAQPATTPAPAPLSRSFAGEDPRRAEIMARVEQTAAERVLAWRDRLAAAGQALTAGQLRALNAATARELRRETEESLAAQGAAGAVDRQAAARMREAFIRRQNETNLRILKEVAPQLTADQVKALRAQLEAGHAARLAGARAERERAASGN